jgi:rhamnose transport system substrate-binding protein
MQRRPAALLALVLVVAAGCGKGAAPGTAAGGTAGGSASGERLKVVYIPKNTGNPYFKPVIKGFEDACQEIGCELTTLAPANAEGTSQVSIIKEQIQRRVDVIAISANSPDALNQVLDQARSRGITVVTVDSDLVGNESHRDAAVLPADFGQIGEGQVELLGSLIGYEGDFAILSATPDAPNQNAWIAGMKETLKNPKYAKMRLVDTVYGDDEPQKSTTECEALLAKHPNLRGIISPTSVGLAAGAQVLEQSGRFPGGPKATGPGIQLTGLSTPNQLKKFVQNGVVTSFQLWDPYNEGYLAAYLGTQIHGKKLQPKAGASIETPKLGKQTFSEKLELVSGPLVTFDKKNIAQFDF